ncbi:2292_t:CDS:2, partial [Scutellospora calospora]
QGSHRRDGRRLHDGADKVAAHLLQPDGSGGEALLHCDAGVLYQLLQVVEPDGGCGQADAGRGEYAGYGALCYYVGWRVHARRNESFSRINRNTSQRILDAQPIQIGTLMAHACTTSFLWRPKWVVDEDVQ